MYETTTPPQKALNIYSQAPWLLICLLFFTSPLLGQSCPQPDSTGSSYDQTQQFEGSSAGQKFGGSLAMSGNLKVVGSPQAGSNSQGEAEVFRRHGDTWISEGLLPASSLQAGERFGTSVDVDDNGNGVSRIAVSTRPVGSSTGQLIHTYTFCNTGPPGQPWELSNMVQSFTYALVGSAPGSSVAIDDDTLVIGVPFSWGGGAIEIYSGDCNGWNNERIIYGDELMQSNPTGPELHRLGSWVDVDGDKIIVGDPAAAVDGEANAGAAYFIQRVWGSGWSICNDWQEQLTAAAATSGVVTAGENFGGSVAIAGDVVVIGASNAQGGPGSAYVFRRRGTSPQDKCNLQFEQQLTADNGVNGDAFGRAVAVIADFPDSQQPLVGTGRIVVGALLADTAGTNSGSAYVYDYALTNNTPEWTQVVELQPDDPSADDRFGVNVALANCTIGVASHLKDASATNAGGTTLFLAPECNDCVEVNSVNVAANSTSSLPCSSDVMISLSSLSGCLIVGAEVSIVHPFGLPPGVPYPYGYGGALVSPSFLNFNTPIPPGDDIPISVLISEAVGGSCVCLEIVLHADNGSEFVVCCTRTVCVEIPLQAGCGDCNGNGVPDDIDILIGESDDCDGNGMPDDCLLAEADDCNNNGIPDSCEIASGSSLDLNNNGTPDECEDCNHNGVPDDLDIASGFSLDQSGPNCVSDGIPDECQIIDCIVGDTNGDGQRNIADVVTLLSYLFSGGDLPAAENADFNEDSVINIADAIALLEFLFGG